MSEITQYIPKSMTAEDATEAVYVKMKRQYQNRVWSDADLAEMKRQLGHYKPEWILSACDEVIGTEEFYHVSKLRKCCEDYAHNERMEALYNEPDPFPESSMAQALPTEMGFGLNGKLLAAQIAFMNYQHSEGVTAPVKVPFRSKEHNELKNRIEELTGLNPHQKGKRVAEIVGWSK